MELIERGGDSVLEVMHGSSLSDGVLEWRHAKNNSYFEAELTDIDPSAKCPYCIALESRADAFWVDEAQLRLVDPTASEVP